MNYSERLYGRVVTDNVTSVNASLTNMQSRVMEFPSMGAPAAVVTDLTDFVNDLYTNRPNLPGGNMTQEKIDATRGQIATWTAQTAEKFNKKLNPLIFDANGVMVTNPAVETDPDKKAAFIDLKAVSGLVGKLPSPIAGQLGDKMTPPAPHPVTDAITDVRREVVDFYAPTFKKTWPSWIRMLAPFTGIFQPAVSLADSTIGAVRGKNYLDTFAAMSHVEGYKKPGENPLKYVTGTLRHIGRGVERFTVKKIIGFGKTRKTKELIAIAKSTEPIINKSKEYVEKLAKAGIKFHMEHEALSKKGAYLSKRERQYKDAHGNEIMQGVTKLLNYVIDQSDREQILTNIEHSLKFSPGKYWFSNIAIAAVGFVKAIGIAQVVNLFYTPEVPNVPIQVYGPTYEA